YEKDRIKNRCKGGIKSGIKKHPSGSGCQVITITVQTSVLLTNPVTKPSFLTFVWNGIKSAFGFSTATTFKDRLADTYNFKSQQVVRLKFQTDYYLYRSYQ